MEDLANSDISKDAAPYVSSDFDVAIAGLDGSFRCKADQSILGAMIAAGRRPIAVGCRSGGCGVCRMQVVRSEEHTSKLQSLMRISYAVFCLKKKNKINHNTSTQ